MADYNSILKAINEKSDREVTLFSSKFEGILEVIAIELAAMSIEADLDPLDFDFKFQRILKDAGYYDLVNEFIDSSYDMSYDDIKYLFDAGGLSMTYTADDIKALKTIKNLDIAFFAQIGNDASATLKRDLYKYSLSDLSKVDMIENIKVSLEGTPLAKHSKTYAQTALSNYFQSVIDIKSSEFDNAVFIYRGVDDKKNRKFCQCLLDQRKYYTRADAMRIRSDKRRQYNCRHVLAPMDLDFAAVEGYKEGSFSC